MADVSTLNVNLYGETIGTLTLLPGDRSIFAFAQAYVDRPNRSTLSLSFMDDQKGLITNLQPTQTKIIPFFSNLLPEGHLRKYLADRAGVKQMREFPLLWVLGHDLPGAVTVTPAEGEALPPSFEEEADKQNRRHKNVLKFSLAGVQLKFSALRNVGKNGGLTIPAEGIGGSWIIKLPADNFEGVPENEFSMMTIAEKMGMDVPDILLVDIKEIEGLPDDLGKLRGSKAFAIKRFDRSDQGPVHMEDFAQVFGVYPDEKYDKASYRNIATVLGIETSEDDVREFIRRLIFSTLIGNADMHLKNWSLIYPDKRNAALAPAYDFVSTIPYISDETAALKYARTKKMKEFDLDELVYLAAKARLPEKLVLDTAKDTVGRFHEVWKTEKRHIPAAKEVVQAVDAHISRMPVAGL